MNARSNWIPAVWSRDFRRRAVEPSRRRGCPNRRSSPVRRSAGIGAGAGDRPEYGGRHAFERLAAPFVGRAQETESPIPEASGLSPRDAFVSITILDVGRKKPCLGEFARTITPAGHSAKNRQYLDKPVGVACFQKWGGQLVLLIGPGGGAKRKGGYVVEELNNSEKCQDLRFRMIS